jgi:Zn-dependent metalloprotease
MRTTRFLLRKPFVPLLTTLLCAYPSSIHFAQAGDPHTTSTQTVSQANKPSLLQQESLVSHVESGKYSQVRMRPGMKVESHDFFTRYAKDFGLSNDDTFKPVLSRPNPLQRARSQNIIRCQQQYKNLPVMGMEYVLQTDSATHVLAASGKIISGLNVDTRPSVSESQALEAAKRAVPAESYPWDKDASKVPQAILAISFKDFKVHRNNARLVYRFTISSERPPQSYVVEVDAHSGEVINKISNRIRDVVNWHQNIPNCQLTGLGNWSQSSLVCDQGTDGKYRLMCVPGPLSACVAKMQMIDGRRPNPQAQNGADPNQDYVFADEDGQNPPIFGEQNVPGESDDIIGEYLYVSMLQSMRFYYSYFRWAGLDGLAQIPVLACVKPTNDPNAAALYNTADHSIWFDPSNTAHVTVDSNGDLDTWLATTAGHEFTHGVLRQMIPLWAMVGPAGETASLDESFSDIMGIMGVYYFFLCSNYDFTTCLAKVNGAQTMSNPQALNLPATYKGYFYAGSEGCSGSDTCYHTPQTTVACDSSNNNCDPDHRNATVQEYMFYLLTAGGAGINDPPLNHPYNVEGIGPFEAAQIAFKTMSVELTATSTYPEARDAWIAAADDLYGETSKEVRAVTLAWYAVGIGDISGTDVSHSPADGDQKVPPWPATLEWEDQPGEVAWEVQTSTSPNFDRDLLTKDTAATISPPFKSSFSSIDFNLKPDANYYWRVRAKRNSSSSGKSSNDSKIVAQPLQNPTIQTGWGDWSLLRYFKTDTRASTLESPVGMSPKVYPWNGEFKWRSVEGGKQYWLDTSEDEDLGLGSNLGPGKVVLGSPQIIQPNNPLQSLSLTGTFVDPNDPDNTEASNLIKHVLPFPLKVNHTYYWGILPYGPENIQGNWSNNQKGQIFETSIPQANLTSPENAATVSPWGIVLEWEETKGAIGYVLKVSTHPDVSDNIYTGSDPTSTSQVLNLPVNTSGGAGLSQGPQIGAGVLPVVEGIRKDYYWSVTPKGPAPYDEKGLASQIWGFDLDQGATKPVLISPLNGSYVPYKQSSLRFTWKPVEHATEYVFNLYNRNDDGSRGTPVINSISVSASQESDGQAYVELNNQGVTNQAGYCWQVQAIGPKDLQGNSLQGPPSDTFCYSLGPDTPILTNPADGASDVEYDSTTFTWESEWAPGGYSLDFGAIDTNGICQSAPVNVTGKSYTVNLKPGTNYCWQVTAKGSTSDAFTRSGIAHFSTKTAPCDAPDAPQTVDPQGGWNSPNIWNPYQYQWSSVPGAVQYEFTVYYVPDWQNPTVRSVVYHNFYTGTTSDPVSLNCNYWPYLWTIRAKSSCGAWSATDGSGWISCQ